MRNKKEERKMPERTTRKNFAELLESLPILPRNYFSHQAEMPCAQGYYVMAKPLCGVAAVC